MIVLVAILITVLFSVAAFWHTNPVLFMAASGAALMTGLYMPNLLGDSSMASIGVGLTVVLYSLVMVAFAYRLLLKGIGGKG